MNAQAWIERHAQTLLGSLGRLARRPAGSALTVAVIGIALLLPLLFGIFLANLRAATAGWNSKAVISVYMNPHVGNVRLQAVVRQLKAMAEVGAVQVITADEALLQFRRLSGFGNALDALTDNPLPDTLLVTPAAAAGTPTAVDALKARIAAMPDVQTVQADIQWITRLQGLLDALRRMVWLTGTLLGVGVVLVVGNTIRLDVLNHRGEIEVLKLVGATDAFTRRPFLYSGIWYGVGGALLALVLCAAVVGILNRPVEHLAGLYGSRFRLHGVGLRAGAAVLLSAGVLGWLGSWLAATRHIHGIVPT